MYLELFRLPFVLKACSKMVAWLSFVLWGCFVHPPLRTCALHYVAPTAATQWVVWRQHSRTSQCSTYGPRACTADGTHAAIWLDEPASNAYARGTCSSSWGSTDEPASNAYARGACSSSWGSTARNSANASLEGRYQCFVSCRYQCSCGCSSWCWTRRYACRRCCCRASKVGWQELVVGWEEIPALGLAVLVPNKAAHTPGAMCAGRYASSSGLPRWGPDRWNTAETDSVPGTVAKTLVLRRTECEIWTNSKDADCKVHDNQPLLESMNPRIWPSVLHTYLSFALGKMTKAQHAYTAHKVCGPRLQSFSIRLVRLQEIDWMGDDEAPPLTQTPMTRCLVALMAIRCLLVLPPRLPQWCLLEKLRPPPVSAWVLLSLWQGMCLLRIRRPKLLRRRRGRRRQAWRRLVSRSWIPVQSCRVV